MKVKLLRRFRKKAKACTWLEYSDGYYRAYKKAGNGKMSYTLGTKHLKVAIRDLTSYRIDLILDWVEDIKEERINKEIRKL